jgi:hypothetical protein
MRTMPARASSVSITARHMKACSARDVLFTADKPAAPPAFGFEEAAGVDVDRMIVPKTPSLPVFSLHRVADFLLRNSPGLPEKRLFSGERETL